MMLHCTLHSTPLERTLMKLKTQSHELQKVFKWLDVNKLCLNVSNPQFMSFHKPTPKKIFLNYHSISMD